MTPKAEISHAIQSRIHLIRPMSVYGGDLSAIYMNLPDWVYYKAGKEVVRVVVDGKGITRLQRKAWYGWKTTSKAIRENHADKSEEEFIKRLIDNERN
jgi:hypothetical protein